MFAISIARPPSHMPKTITSLRFDVLMCVCVERQDRKIVCVIKRYDSSN